MWMIKFWIFHLIWTAFWLSLGRAAVKDSAKGAPVKELKTIMSLAFAPELLVLAVLAVFSAIL
jgi:hypothetical protein